MSELPALCMTPGIAAPSGSKARMFEHMDVRAGKRFKDEYLPFVSLTTDVVLTVMPARGSERNQGNLEKELDYSRHPWRSPFGPPPASGMTKIEKACAS